MRYLITLQDATQESDEWGQDTHFLIKVIKNIYTPGVKKGRHDTLDKNISLLNIDRFSQFFHRHTQLELCNKIITKDPTSPQMCCYTTL